ncbi:hypothetical protein XCR_4168 [Xanthomonas campestris pv. raphani 756C]|nr:hypothetical protein XCR_4168 [Xanthomonas campestris pv. raphani 756C]
MRCVLLRRCCAMDADGMDAGFGCLEAVHLDACWVKLCVSLQ